MQMNYVFNRIFIGGKMFKNIVIFAVSIFLLIIVTKCFPTYTVKQQNQNAIPNDSLIQVGSKIQTYDDNIYIFPNGFTLHNGSIKGIGQLFNIDSSDGNYSKRTIPLENVATINYYEETTSGGRHLASFLFSITGPPLAVLSLYCVSCPKCCFGSCPTIYTKGTDGYLLETELFSECISRQLENSDVDLLSQKIDDCGYVELMIANEALETHYINKFELVAINHPIGTKLFPTFNDSLILVNSFTKPSQAYNSDGNDITDLIQKDDSEYYRTGTENINDFKNGILFDWIDINYNTVGENKKVKVVIKYRNTLLSTILLYDVVLASQGIEALEWTDRMNNDADYASTFKMIYDDFSGIDILSGENNKWRKLGSLKDAGPITWRYAAIEVPVNEDGNLNLRFKFISDNMLIDYISIDTSSIINNNIKIDSALSFEIRNESDEIENNVDDLIQKDDKQYLITNPGDNYRLKYKFLKRNNTEQTLAIFSKGYYNEWIRGEWIREKGNNYKFNLYDIHGTLSYLADSWILNKDIIEKEFFNNRIPLRGRK